MWLQVAEYGFLTQKAARQQQRSIEVSPPRGVICDRKGRELAMSIQVDSVFAVPSGDRSVTVAPGTRAPLSSVT